MFYKKKLKLSKVNPKKCKTNLRITVGTVLPIFDLAWYGFADVELTC